MYKAKCNKCNFGQYAYSFHEMQLERISEEHMIQTGHIVTIKVTLEEI